MRAVPFDLDKFYASEFTGLEREKDLNKSYRIVKKMVENHMYDDLGTDLNADFLEEEFIYNLFRAHVTEIMLIKLCRDLNLKWDLMNRNIYRADRKKLKWAYYDLERDKIKIINNLWKWDIYKEEDENFIWLGVLEPERGEV